MKKFFSLLKASSKGEMSVFKINSKTKNTKLLLFVFLSFSMMYVAYTYAKMIGEPLNKIGLTYVLLTLFSLAVVVLNIMETIYKSQGIIFDAKDNNLLFSLPIKKSSILTSRILKLLAFDYLFQILFIVPCFIEYIILVHPSISFYILSILFFILLPLIPMIIGSILGYMIKAFSSHFKNKKMIQTVVSLLIFFVIYALVLNLNGLITNLAKNATSINDLISKVYLPIGLYIELIQKFNLVKLLELILISILPFIIFIYIFQFKYDYIINNSKETSKKKRNKKYLIKESTVLKSLTKKEMKTYFSIPIYVINTIIGPVFAIIISVLAIIKYDFFINTLKGNDFGLSMTQINNYMPLIIIVMIMLLSALTSITSSSISLEGKKLSLVKSLPIDPYKVFLSKVLVSDILIIPAMLLSAIMMIIRFKIFNYYIIFILAFAVIFPHLIGELGLLVNLKYPKLDFNSEVEVVKQSLSVLVSIMTGLVICFTIIFTYLKVEKVLGSIPSLSIYLIIIIAITFIIDKLLKTYGIKKYNEL